MNGEGLERIRQDTADAILGKVGEAFAEAERSAADMDPASRKLMAARIALEYAVLATARERNMATAVVAQALTDASVAQQEAMAVEGAAALARAYRVEPAVLVNVFAGQMVESGLYALPAPGAFPAEVRRMVDTCQNLFGAVLAEAWSTTRSRGQMDGPSSFIAAQPAAGISARGELAARLAFLESSVDAAAGRGVLAPARAEQLRSRIEDAVFSPTPGPGQGFSDPMAAFTRSSGTRLRIEAMTEVRGVVRSHTVQEILSRLKEVMQMSRAGPQPSDHRSHQPRER